MFGKGSRCHLASYSKGLSGTDKSLTETGVKNRKKVGLAVAVAVPSAVFV